MAGFLTSNTVSLPTGSKVVSLTGGVNCSFVVSGTAVFINGTLFEGVSGTSPDVAENSTITLRSTYTGTSIINGTLVVFNTIEGLRDAIQRARELAATQVTNNSQLDVFLTNATASVDLELPSGTVTVSPYQYISGLVLGNDVRQYAMSQAQFEAIRVQNKERYAASGWVSFGNHESGKQVNECKSGLYTALTTPNTLLIGKTGGVGGSKTDYASVNIDGVVFNLTNEFVITLPLHPTSVLPERMDMYGVESEKVEISLASPNAYQGGLRGVGATVDLFTATDQQKKDFFAQNSNTTYIGSDGKIYQYQLYNVAFAGTTDGDPSPTEQGYSLNSLGDLWIKSGKNLLYFGNALRLNDGGYHHLYNPLGAARFVGDTFWYNTAASITSKADCFDPAKLLAGSGSIASGKSGRPEIGGRYYDSIYASGFGGVCRDMRYSANHTTLEKFAEADLNAKNGTYRGFEKLVITRIIQVAVTEVGSYIGGHYIVSNVGDFTSLADKQYSLFYNKTRNIIGYIPVVETDNLYLSTNPRCKGLPNIANYASGMTVDPYTGTQVGDEFYLIAGSLMTNSVGGSYLQTDVIGDPANILLTDALKNGWEGSWIPDLPAGGGKLHYGTRKNINLVGSQLLASTNNGATWNSFITGTQVANITNALTGSYATNEIRICQYQAFAKQTNPTGNTGIYGGTRGLGGVYSNARFATSKGTLLGESLIDKICISDNQSSIQSRTLALSSFSIRENGLLSQDNFESAEHSVLNMGSPTNSSPAFKVLNYNTAINQQANINYAATELKWDGTDWGDDARITIVDGESTKTDLKGNTVKVVTHKLKEPIGWCTLKL